MSGMSLPTWQAKPVITRCCLCTLRFVGALNLTSYFSLSERFAWFIIQVDLYYFCYYKDAVSVLMRSTRGIFCLETHSEGSSVTKVTDKRIALKGDDTVQWISTDDCQETHAETLKSLFATGEIQLEQWNFSVLAVCVLMVCCLV